MNAAAAVGLCTTQNLVLSDEVCAAAAAVAIHVALAALRECAAQCSCSPFISAFVLHAALVAHRLGGVFVTCSGI